MIAPVTGLAGRCVPSTALPWRQTPCLVQGTLNGHYRHRPALTLATVSTVP